MDDFLVANTAYTPVELRLLKDRTDKYAGGRLIETSRSKFYDGSHSVPIKPVKPFQNVVNVGSAG